MRRCLVLTHFVPGDDPSIRCRGKKAVASSKKTPLQIVLPWRAEKIHYFTGLDDLDAVLDAAGDGI